MEGGELEWRPGTRQQPLNQCHGYREAAGRSMTRLLILLQVDGNAGTHGRTIKCRAFRGVCRGERCFWLFKTALRKSVAGKCIQCNSPALAGKGLETGQLWCFSLTGERGRGRLVASVEGERFLSFLGTFCAAVGAGGCWALQQS